MRVTIFLTSIFVFGFSLAQNQTIGCNVPGFCEDSHMIGLEDSVPNADDCLEICQNNSDCTHYSYQTSSQFCVYFGNCINLSTDNCHDCISGDASCNVTKCFVQGRCDGTIVGLTIEQTPEACSDACRSNPRCNFFTHDSDGMSCVLTLDCDVDESCPTCVYGERDCHNGLSKILIIGGAIVTGSISDAEIIDMARPENLCLDPPDYPIITEGLVTAMVDKVPWVCGGYWCTNQCFSYHNMTNTWLPERPMLECRYRAAGALIKGGTEWWITGGRYDYTGCCTGIYRDTTEILRNGEFVFGPDLPEALGMHCLVTINVTHVFLVGGLSSTGVSNRAYIYDFSAWQEVAEMSVARHSMACSLITTEEFGTEIVITGGASPTTEIFSLNTMTWRSGPPYPMNVYYPATVPYKNSFLVLGGMGINTTYNFDDIYELNVEAWSWSKPSQTLNLGRRNFAALMLDDNMVTCSKNM